MSSTTLVVSIGRNRGSEPMNSDDWQSFRLLVLDDLRLFGTIVFSGTGIGYWDGAYEESATFVLTLAETSTGTDMAQLHAFLADDARDYGQVAVAVTTGTTYLVEASKCSA